MGLRCLTIRYHGASSNDNLQLFVRIDLSRVSMCDSVEFCPRHHDLVAFVGHFSTWCHPAMNWAKVFWALDKFQYFRYFRRVLKFAFIIKPFCGSVHPPNEQNNSKSYWYITQVVKNEETYCHLSIVHAHTS